MTGVDTYDVGDAIISTVTFRAEDGTPANPSVVTATVRAPDGTVTPRADFTTPAVGVRKLTVVGTAPGVWVVRWVGTGTVAATIEQVFGVRQLAIEGFLIGFYGDDPAVSPTDQLRFLLGDTDNADLILSDNQLDALLATTSTDGKPTTTTVIRGLHAIAARYSRMIDGSNGDVSRSYSQRAGAYRAMADAVRAEADLERADAERAATFANPMIAAGGIDGCTDFAVGMMDAPGTVLGGRWPDRRAGEL